MHENNPTDTWTCPNCDELIETNFDSCWRCGTDREGTPPASPAIYTRPDNYTGLERFDAREIAPCPICDSISFSWDNIMAKSFEYSEPSDELGVWYKPQLRRCLACGNLQLFT